MDRQKTTETLLRIVDIVEEVRGLYDKETDSSTKTQILLSLDSLEKGESYLKTALYKEHNL